MRAPDPIRTPAPLQAQRPPRAPKPMKAASAADCEVLEQLPNIGPSLAADLRSIGVQRPQDLAGKDALQLYRALCTHSGQRQDPCVLDTFMAATDFMRGAAPRPWWTYTAQRKQQFGKV
jgi:hypothetical protein